MFNLQHGCGTPSELYISFDPPRLLSTRRVGILEGFAELLVFPPAELLTLLVVLLEEVELRPKRDALEARELKPEELELELLVLLISARLIFFTDAMKFSSSYLVSSLNILQ